MLAFSPKILGKEGEKRSKSQGTSTKGKKGKEIQEGKEIQKGKEIQIRVPPLANPPFAAR